MLTIIGIVRKSRQMEQWEKDWLLHVIVEYAKSGNGSWLDEIPFEDCEYMWCDAMTCDNGVRGARPMFGKKIYLASCPNGEEHQPVIRNWLETIAPVAIHELRHMWQQKKFGIPLWTLLRIPELFPPLYGKLIVERDAIAIEGEADEFLKSQGFGT